MEKIEDTKSEILLNTKSKMYLVDEHNKIAVECVSVYNDRGIITTDHTDNRNIGDVIGYTPKMDKDGSLLNARKDLVNEDYLSEILKKFGDYVLDNMRLHDMGGKIRMERVKKWMERELSEDA